MKLILLCCLTVVVGCTNTELRALDRNARAPKKVDDYDDAANYLADKSGVIAICRAAIELDGTDEHGEYCTHVFKDSEQIKNAVLIWLNASDAEQQRWFERNPYEYRDMQNAIKDYDTIIQIRSNNPR